MKFRFVSFCCFVFSFSSYAQISQDVNALINDYSTRIVQNGGSISAVSLSAVTNFVTAAKNHQYWDKLVDIGPLTGNNINAALVKLKFPVNGSSTIENNGFLPSDYVSNRGFQLDPSKSINTKTNLSTLNLQGLFGFSMWLMDGGTAWMGSPNSSVPYSLLHVQPTQVFGFIGTPPAYAVVSGNIPPSSRALYHLIRQSLNSIKTYVDDSEVGAANIGSSATQLRNADVQVFKESGSLGKGQFYCIDDGTLTNSEVSQFYTDVKQLMDDLGRKPDTEIADYSTRIIQNGSSISNNDLSAIRHFVSAAKDHQYWDKLIDVAPLAGTDVNAAMVKLKYPANGSSLITNSGYQPADYASDQGLQLNPAKSLNSNVNLNILNLQGLFGFSMLLSNGGTGWMGSPNNNVPYSLLVATPVRVEAFIGDAGGYGGVIPSTDIFYHVIKQSLTSTKVFVNNSQVDVTNNTLTSTQLRNANVEVFREAGNVGNGMFYCIDNGTLTDAEVSFFYNDVLQLMFGLGRKLASPVISAAGSYNTPQQVTITPAPTGSALAGATIYYTTDGSIPTNASPVYTAPITVSATTHIQAMAVKNTEVSTTASSWVAIVPTGFNTTKYYTAHVMINLLAFTSNMTQWLTTMKAAGYNLIWAHLDDYTGNYITTLQSLMNAADSVGGIQIMPGASWWVPADAVSHMYLDTWNHPSLFRIGGKRVYTAWDYKPDNQGHLDYVLSFSNILRDQYYLWPCSRYPFSYDGGNTWVGEHLSPYGYLDWSGNSSAGQNIDIAHLYQTRPLDGLINFAVDQGDKQNTIRTNRLITQTSIQQGKFSMGGVSAFYASVSFSDFGFRGAAEVWDSLLALPLTGRPTAMSDITANDYAELSYMSPMVVPPTNGLSFIPPLSSGFTLGNMIRYPLTDHGGIQKFLRPWVDAFLNNQPVPVFTQDRMFAWYWLHPKDQAPSTAVPALFSPYPNLNQQWWNNTVYATGSIDVGNTNQINGMKTYIGAGMEKIRMAAHLTAPARLKINDSISDLKPAGAAFYEIEMGSFRGTPTFSIIRGGVEVNSGTGPQPITNNVFPGGWNFLATEVTGAQSRHFRSRTSGSWDSVNTWQSSADSMGWNNANTVPSNLAGGITIQNGHTIVITDSAVVDQLYIQDGAALYVAPHAWLRVTDGPGDDITIAPGGKLVIQSDSTGTVRTGTPGGALSKQVTEARYNGPASNYQSLFAGALHTAAKGNKPDIRSHKPDEQDDSCCVINNKYTDFNRRSRANTAVLKIKIPAYHLYL